MKTGKRLFPVVCITAIVLVIFLLLYGEIMEREEDKCWKELSSTAQNVSREITTKFRDEIVKLHLIKDIMLQDGILEVDDLASLHLENFQPTTIFARIDVLYPDNTLIVNGIERRIYEDISFEDMAADGEYLTKRMTDSDTGKDCIYYVMPITEDNEVYAVLIGVIELKELSEIFRPIIYNEQANICIVDSTDGSYLMDSWHEELGNAYAMEEREKVKGYEDVDFKKAMRNMESGELAFVSRTTGKPLYMYYTPLGMYEWQLLIFIQEKALFGSLMSMRAAFIFAGLIEALMLIMYFAWNIRMVRLLEKRNAEIEEQKELLRNLSYRDNLTSMYNRTKYAEDWKILKERSLHKMGVAYIDLNGLKQVNDTQSHDAGDAYIRDTARIISDLFAENSYRIGGDEFVVFGVEMDNREFTDRLERLKKNMEKENISISIGYMWEDICNNLDMLLKEAEIRMYKDKERYYLTHEKWR